MEILFKDENIVVCIKPVGLLSQADNNGGESMITRLSSLCGGEIYPLHRLDREVGGVMIYARTKSAAAALSADIAKGDFKKEYIALVHGKPSAPCGEMHDLLFKDSRKNKSFVVKRMRKGVKEALLEYHIINTEKNDETTLSAVRVILHTGRTHQIRVQFASRGMPLAGDRKYGAKDCFSSIGLWSFRLCFNHPVSREEMQFCVKPHNFIKDYL